VPEIIVPSTLRERLEALGGRRRDAWLVVAIIAVVVLGALALRSRSVPAQVAPPSTSSDADTRGPATQPTSAAVSPAPQGVVLVHVAGAVRRPGLYELPLGARIADAVKAARGPRRGADLDAINLAEAVADGAKVEVPRRGSAVAPAAGVPMASPSPTAALVNINQADQVELETLPGIGPVTATAILDYRSEIGAFSSVEQLLDVSGIGPVTLENVRPYISI
jgi:competence protein ComEA